MQNIFNAVWLAFDIGILYTYFKFGQKYFRTGLKDPSARTDGADKTLFIAWSVLGLVTAFGVAICLSRRIRGREGRRLFGISAKISLMSVLFIAMLAGRGNREGQSLSIAINKWIGTLAPTILYGLIGEGGFPRGSFLILVAGILCSVFDLIYIRMLMLTKRPAHQGRITDS
mgnify:CR=1 FL=1